jgi:LPS-assembly protein
VPRLNRILIASASILICSFLPAPRAVLAQTAKKINQNVRESTQNKAVRVTADHFTQNTDSGEMLAEGNVVVVYDKVRLTANKARVNTQTKDALAEGNVVLRHGYKEFKAARMDFNFGTGAVRTGRARAQFNQGIFFETESIESADDKKYVLKNAYVTTSDYADPGYRIKARTINIYPEDRIVLHHIVFHSGSVPLFYFPYLVWSIAEDEINGINTGTHLQFGSRGNWGFFILNSYSTMATQGLRTTYHLDYRELRGIAGGIDLRYNVGEPYNHLFPNEDFKPSISGKVRTYYSEDEKVRDANGQVEVVRNESPTTQKTTTQTISPNRYQLKLGQNVRLREDIYSKIKINKFSDPNFQEDFFENEFVRDPQPDNFIEITHWAPNSMLSLLARPQANDFFTTTERLPELRFDLKRQQILDTPLFYEGENSVAYLAKEFAHDAGLADYSTARADTFHQILHPKKYFGWLTFIPRVGGRATFYERAPTALGNEEPSIVRTVFNTGFHASFKASRTWKHVKNEKWEIDGLRHLIEPDVNYGLVFKPSHDPSQLHQFDVQQKAPELSKHLVPIDFPQNTGIDSIDERHVVRPTVRQRLQTKRDGATWDLAELLLYQDILVEKNKEEHRFSDLFATMMLRPVRWFTAAWTGRYDHENSQLRESSTNLTFYDRKRWRAELSHLYFRDVGDQLGAGFGWAINENWAFRTSVRFNPVTLDLFENSISLDRDLHSWIASLSFSQLHPLNREVENRIWLALTLKEFPGVSLTRQAGDVSE